MKSFVCVLLSIFLLGPLVSFADEQVIINCLQIPESFESWRLLFTDENRDRIKRRFQHPKLPNCQGESIALLNDCKEYLITKGAFVLGTDGILIEEVAAALRMPDDSWKNGAGMGVEYEERPGTKGRVAIFTLESDPPVVREIPIPNPCE